MTSSAWPKGTAHKKNMKQAFRPFPLRALTYLLCMMLVLPGCVAGTQSGTQGHRAQSHMEGRGVASAPISSADRGVDQRTENYADQSGTASARGASAGASQSFSRPAPYGAYSLQTALFNATASFLGLPGLASVYGADGLRDEGLGFHADGTTRRADGSSGTDSAPRFDGQRSAAYIRSAELDMYAHALNRPWLYDDVMGMQRGQDGRLMRMGDEYSVAASRGVPAPPCSGGAAAAAT